MKIVLLDAETLGADADLQLLRNLGDLTLYPRTDSAQTITRIGSAEVVITNKVVIDRSVMDACSGLKLICVAATGMNNIDLDYAHSKNIIVKNVAGYSTPSVVQQTFALLFHLLHQTGYYDQYTKSGTWERDGLFSHIGRPFFELPDKTWGIIGLGSIGSQVAHVASAFGAHVAYYSASGKNRNNQFPRLELLELLEHSDIVSIHAPLNPSTQRLLHKDNLALLKPGSILLNLGRGGIVDENDLAETIDSGEIMAGLDVTESEPLPASSPLLQLKHPERLVVTPHIAWAGRESRTRLIQGIADNIQAYAKTVTG